MGEISGARPSTRRIRQRTMATDIDTTIPALYIAFARDLSCAIMPEIGTFLGIDDDFEEQRQRVEAWLEERLQPFEEAVMARTLEDIEIDDDRYDTLRMANEDLIEEIEEQKAAMKKVSAALNAEIDDKRARIIALQSRIMKAIAELEG